MLKKIKLTAKDWIANSQKRFGGDEGPRRLTMCKTCYTFYYKNAWHFDKPGYLQMERDEEIPVRFTQCPACLEQEVALYDFDTDSDLVWRRA